MFYFYKTSRKGICAHQFASCELPSFLYSAHCFASILSSTHYKQVKKTIIILYIIHCLDIFYIIFRIIASYFVKNITNDCIFLYFRIIRCFYQSVTASCLPTKNYFYRLCFYKLLICSCTTVSAGYFNIFKKFLNLIATAIFRRNRLNYRYRNLSAQGEFFKLLPGKYLY